MACGFSAKRWCLGVSLGFTALLLAGCDNTNIAFCSGSDEFCGDFFDNTFRDDDEPHPPNDDTTVTEAALAIANGTPEVVASAIAQQEMADLIASNPDVVGLWLTASTLGKLIAADHVAVSEFLDQNRAWLMDTATRSESTVLAQGMSLFAEFAAGKDPALAQAAASQIPHSAENSPARAGEDMSNLAQRIVASHNQDHCCNARSLAAASVVLCASPLPGIASNGIATPTACANATQWLAEDEAAATH